MLRHFTGPPLPKRVAKRMMLGLTALGVDVEKPLSKLGLSLDALRALGDDDLRWSFIYDFWTALHETVPEPGLGLRLGAMARPEYYEVFGYVVSASATLGDALLRAARFMRLAAPNLELSFYVEGERAVLTFKALTPEIFHPESAEFFLAAIGAAARQLTEKHLTPLEVRFAHAPPADLTHHRSMFGDASIQFNRPHYGYVFDSSVLNERIVSSDTQLCARLEREAEEMLAQIPRVGDLSRKVQEAISDELRGGNPSAEHIAEKLGMHPKTLSRRLKTEGTSHQQLLDQLRFQLAERYLRDEALSIGEIAFLLGYSDTSSFNKAFKRWTGSAPQHYRQKAAS
jgi:AraC-like DNA-binding protein